MKKTAIILAALLAASAFAGMRAGNSDSKDTFFRKLNTFNSVVRELQTGYVDTIDAEELMDNAIGMMLYQLDPYTEYYPSGNQDEILALSAGSYAGIGSIISKRGDNVIIADPYWNSPARTGGLRRGDVIVPSTAIQCAPPPISAMCRSACADRRAPMCASTLHAHG